jgi:hypothetical protein
VRCRHTVGRGGCSGGGTGACWCCPDSRGYNHLARLTAGDVTVVDGTATITTPAVAWTLRPADDGLLCGPCAVARWFRILNLVVTRPSNRDIAQALKKAKPGTTGSPHLCRSTRGLEDVTLAVPLLPPIDQWGYVPFPVQRLTPHSLSRRVRDLLSGDLGAHRDLPVDTDAEPQPPVPSPLPVPRAVYRPQDWQTAWTRRHADLQELTGVNDQLDEVDRRANELNRRALAPARFRKRQSTIGRCGNIDASNGIPFRVLSSLDGVEATQTVAVR